ncbi:hypothetical protein G7046_g9716 [Stylonectria norvegica]|nr:hypothetical protein G7046_g9716 [Stylonectria norvegica]
MWRRTYLFLIVIRLWFALSPSYLHPDENFQGPEVIAGMKHPFLRFALVAARLRPHVTLREAVMSQAMCGRLRAAKLAPLLEISSCGSLLTSLLLIGQIFSYPVRHTWEFTSENPIRSVFPLWPVYGLPMLLLRWLWIGNGNDGEITPIAVFWTLRVLMFFISFVLEDWALHELIQSPRHRKIAVLLVASSYVTWTYQTHTFSNSIETLVVAWSLVLIQRLSDPRQRSSVLSATILGIVSVFGIFNRITFPAFLFIPGLRLIPVFWKRPGSLAALVLAGLITILIAIALDTAFYLPEPVWADLLYKPVITPLNNFRYNSVTENLADHGLHPWYQHLVGNLPMLLGPAAALLVFKPDFSLRLYSAISGLIVLSAFQHQEARFLLPTVPLLLSSIHLPKNQTILKIWLMSWIAFNLILGLLMGIYHQGGVVPGQVFLSQQPDATQAIWWKTYTPPIWLLNGKNEVLTTRDVMGIKGEALLEQLSQLATCDTPADRRSQEFLKEQNGTYLMAPASADWLDPYLTNKGLEGLRFREVWRHRQHLNLDDMDFGDDGVWNTLLRVVGRRGLVAWRVTKSCRT